MAFWPSIRTSARGAALVLGALAPFAACKGGDPGERPVAQVGDERITVEEVAEYMSRSNYGVNTDDVARAVDELIDLELVKLRAREQYVPTRSDSFQMNEWSEILLINQFREEVVWADIAIDEAKLREWYDENVSEEAQARHILVSVPATATDAERAAARHEADSLLVEAKAGADFAEMARAHSDDPGSAPNGGVLQWFGKGQMVEPFEKAAFEGSIGEVYPDLVETEFGYHVIQVENRRRPPFEDLHDQIEEQLAQPVRSEAEQAYVTHLMETSGVEFFEANIDTLISLLRAEPRRPVTTAERELDLATYRSGRIMLGEIWDLFDTLPSVNQRAILALDQAQMVQALASLMQQRLLMDEARAKKIELDSTRQRELDERIDVHTMQSYMQQVGRSQLEVADSVVQRYYAEHREFYADQPFEQVREQIRDVLVGQRMEALQMPDAERRILAAVADSQRSGVNIQRHENRYDDVLEVLRKKYEEQGRDPNAAEPAATGTPPSPAEPTDAQGN